MDLRGLAALFGKINALLAEEHTASEDGRDLFGLSRFLQRRGEDVRAATSCTRALDAGLPAEHRHEALRELALLAKRRGEHHLAAELWQKVLQDSRNGMEACEQLAIHFERQERDLLRAKEFTQLGLTKLRTGGLRLRDPYTDARVTRQENGLLRRLARLEQRIAKGQGRMKLHRAAAAGRLL